MISSRKLLSVLLVLAGPLVCRAAPKTVIPADNPIPHEKGWLKECDDRIAAVQGKPVDIIFIGDSVTQNFIEFPKDGWNSVGGAVWAKYYANRNVLNLGVGSDGTEHILWRLDHQDVKNFMPKVIVLMAGLNDMQYPAQDIAAGIKAVLDKCIAMYPSARIVLMGITPNGRDVIKTAAVNQTIKSYADDLTTTFLDLSPRMPPQGNGWLGIGGDRTHLTPQGYEIWASALAPRLRDLLPGR